MEAEADRVAERVVARIERLGVAGHLAGADRRARSAGRVRRSAAGVPPVPRSGGAVDDDTARSISRARRAGAPLPDPVRRTMELGFGEDLSDVRVHAGGDADEANERLGARAFALGSDVFFRGGMPSPASREGRRLIAHEIAHTREGRGPARRRPARTDRIRREVVVGDFGDDTVTHYRRDVRRTHTWPTSLHLHSAAGLEGMRIQLYEEDLSDKGRPAVQLSLQIGTGALHDYSLINTRNNGHWEVLVPADSRDANPKSQTYRLAGGKDAPRFKIHRLDTVENGDCGYDGIHIIKWESKADPKALARYRRHALSDHDDDTVRRELYDIYKRYEETRADAGLDAAAMAAAHPMGLSSRVRAVFERLYDREHRKGVAPSSAVAPERDRKKQTAPTGAKQPSDSEKQTAPTGAKQSSDSEKQPEAAKGGASGNQLSAAKKPGGSAKQSGGSAKQPRGSGKKPRSSAKKPGGSAKRPRTAAPRTPIDLTADPTPGSDLPDPAPKPGAGAVELLAAATKIKQRADEMGAAHIDMYADDMSHTIMSAFFEDSKQQADEALQRAADPGDGNRLALAEEAYRAAQAHYRQWGRQSDKTLTYKSTDDEAEHEAMDVLKGDVDLRIARLVPLLEVKAGTNPDHLKATIRWLGGGDTAELAKRYQVATGVALDDALATCFGGRQSLRYLYAKEIAAKGKPGPNARLALRLGLLYPKWTPFAWNIAGSVPGVTDKERLREFMRDDPASFRALVGMAAKKQDVQGKHHEVEKDLKADKKQAKATKKSGGVPAGGDPEKRFLHEAFLVLEKSGLLGEVAALHDLQETKQQAEDDDTVDVSTSHVRYLVSLVYNTRREEIRHLRFKPPYHVKHLRHDLVAWVKELAGPKDRAQFAAAGRAELSGDDAVEDPKLLNGNRYRFYWEQLRKINLISVEKSRYVVAVAEGQVRADNGEAAADEDEGSRLWELEATLTLQKQKGTWASKRVERSGMVELVRQFLSTEASGKFDAVQAVLHRHNPLGVDRVAKAKDPEAALLVEFGRAWKGFAKVLDGAGISADQQADLRLFVMLHGSTGAEGTAEFNVVDNYIALRNHPHRDESVRLVQALAPGTLEWSLAHRDTILHRYLYLMHGLYNPGGRHLKWKSICAMLDIGLEPPPHAPGETSESLAGVEFEQQILDDDAVSDLEAEGGPDDPARYWAGQLLATSRVDDDGYHLLEVAFDAQNEGVSGPRVLFELKKLNMSIAEELGEGTSKWHRARGENTCYELVGGYLSKRAPITVTDLLHASRAVTKFGVDSELRDKAVEAITVDNVLDYVATFDPDVSVYQKGFEELRARADARLDARLAVYEEQQKKAADTKKIDELNDDIDRLTREIEELEIGIDAELTKRLEKVYREGDVVAQKRRIFLLMGEAIGAGKHGTLEQIRLSESELQFKGVQTKAKSDLVEQRALQSGVSWDHRSTASMEAAEAESMLLSTYWTNQQQLHTLSTKASLSDQDRAKQSALLDEIATSEKDLRETQKYFREVQDRLAKQTVNIVTTILSILIAISGLASGIGAAAGVIQLMWAIGASVLTSIVSQVLKAGLSREGEFSKAEAVKEAIIKLLSDVVTFAVVQELTLAVDLACIGVHTGDSTTQLFGKAALAVIKGQINNWLSDIPEGVVNQFFKRKPILNLAPDIANAFAEKLRSMPAQMFITYVNAFATESFRMGQKEFFAALGADAVSWTPESSMGGIGATDSDGKTTESYDTAMQRGVFGGGDLNQQRQFIFGPQATVGNTAWGGSENLPAVLGTSVKTALYQEVVVAKLRQATGGLAQKGVDVATGSQVEMDIQGPDRQQESDEALSTRSRDEQALAMMVDYFDHIGIRLGAVKSRKDAHAKIRAALPEPKADPKAAASSTGKGAKKTKSKTRAERAIEMFDHYHDRVLALLPHTVKYKGGQKYEGQMVGGRREGEGTYTWPNGDSYVGGWKGGVKSGDGTYQWASGDSYSGEWRDGCFDGTGAYYWASGDIYTGEFVKDMFSGQGTYIFASKSQYTGDFDDDAFHGKGTYTSSTGWSYTGGFDADQFDDVGVLTFADGSCYKGEFKDDEYHGHGGLFDKNGAPVHVGSWRGGKFSKPYGDTVEIDGGKVVLKNKKLEEQSAALDKALADARKLLPESTGKKASGTRPEKRRTKRGDAKKKQPALTE